MLNGQTRQKKYVRKINSIMYRITIMLVTISLSLMLKPIPNINDISAELKTPFKRCINIGNALDAPKGIPWDVTMKVEYFDIIKKAGFDSVRLPVRFSDYAKNSPNYILDEKFMKEIDGYIEYALKCKLVIILDFHHFIEIMNEPEKYKDCFISIWSQLANRYKDYPPELVFELLNEPKNKLRGELWNEYIEDAVKIIRKTNKDRKVIVGPDTYNTVDRLKELSIPKDNNIIVSFHFYEPNKFAFQGNQYEKGFEDLKDVQWIGSKEELQAIKDKFDIAKKWSKVNKVPIFVGEFGAIKNAPAECRKLWIKAVRNQAEQYGFSWGYWELSSIFGIYNVETASFNKEILDVLIDDMR